MAGQRDESGHFWDLLTQLGQCHQAEIDSLKSTCISSHGLPDDFTTDKASLMESHHESIELALTCMGQNEVHVPAVRSSSEGNRGLTRSLSEASIVSVCERSGAPCTSRPSMRVSHTLTGRSQASNWSNASRSANLSDFFCLQHKEEDHARAVGHQMQQQLAGGNSSHSDKDSDREEKLVFQPWQVWSAPELPKRGRRRPTNRSRVLSPMGRTRFLWDLLCLGVVCLELLLLPPLRVFDGAVPFANVARNVLWAAQVVWNFHILVCLNTGYYFRGHLVCTQPGLAAGYLKTWFAFDAANIIVDWLLAAMDVSHNLASRVALKEVNAAVRGLWTMQIALRLSRLVSLRGKLQSFNRHLSDKAGASSIIALTVGQICLMHHVLACLWYGIGILGMDGSWVQANGLDGASVAYRYATALHWTFCQIGLGSSEIEAVNTQERLFSLFVVFAAVLVLSTLLVSVTSMATNLNKANERKQDLFQQLWKYMEQHQVGEDLKMRVSAYLEYAYTLRQSVMVETEVPILDLLSKQLHAELQSFRYRRCLRKLDVMKQLRAVDQHSLQVIRNLPSQLSHRTFAPADTVFECGLLAKAAYFVAEGEFVYELNGTKTSVANGRWVAEMCLWTPWLHLGDLTTRDVAAVVILDVSRFADTLRRSSESFLKAQEYARDWVERMNGEQSITDLWSCEVAPEVAPLRSSSDHPQSLGWLEATRHVLFCNMAPKKRFSQVVPGG
ncbi:Hcn4 [Symbiodinium natans]|uniref:Hcn4 protein n=1 Tax=Symbiodinium natans TaxID=878477 RepID=A0A812KBP3_9DINO|nr:Hcn4 [Symbiodinium natans]